MTTLYRKYRPQTFADTYGQNFIKIILEHQISTEQTVHAYLFCGPRGVAKTTLARVMAKAVNCTVREAGQSEPCGKCQSCIDITEGRAMDVMEIDAASNTGVDNVRENIIVNSRVAPTSLKKKVFIIDEVHMLSTAAFNALLKTLEEPPANVIFILCTTEIHKVPQTIISRCQRFDFKRISLTDMVKKLQAIVTKEGIKIDKKILEAVARHADGHLRDAESLLGQLVNVGGKEITEDEASLVIPRNNLFEVLNLLLFIAQKNGGEAIRLINKMVDDGVDLKYFVTDLIDVLRRLLILKINPSLIEYLSLEMGENFEAKINEVKDGLNAEQVIYLVENFSRAATEMKNSFIMQLPLELVIARLSFAAAPAVSVNKAATPVPASSPVVLASTIGQAANVSSVTPSASLPISSVVVDKNLVITLDDIMAKWQEFLLQIKKHNHSLSFILRVCEPRQVEGNKVCLAFKYKFHKDRVSDPNVRGLIEQIMQEVHGAEITIEAIIDENISTDLNSAPKLENISSSPVLEKTVESPKKEELNPAINDLLEAFGGKIVG